MSVVNSFSLKLGFPGSSEMVKNLLTKGGWGTWVLTLGLEDPQEKRMATHSSIFAWRIPGTEDPGRLQSIGLQRVGHDQATFTSFSLKFARMV